MSPPVRLLSCTFAGGLSLCAALAHSTPPAAPPVPATGAWQAAGTTLAAAVEAAWARAVAAREVHGQRQRALADQTVAAALWAGPPALGVSHRDDRLASASGGRETEASVSWPLWLPGQRAARAATASADLALADATSLAARLQLAGEVRSLGWAQVALAAEAAQVSAQRHTLQALADDVQRRVQAGDLARADALAARAEWMASTAQLADLAQRLAAAQAQWLLLTGLHTAPRLADLAEPVLVDLAEPAQAGGSPPTLHRHPAQLAAQQAVQAARLRLDRVRLSPRDAPELSLRVLSSVPGRSEPASTSIGIALRVPLGTQDRNQPLLAAALVDLDVAQAQARRVADALQAQQASAHAALVGATAQADAEGERATLLRERADLIRKSFQAGESPLPDLLRALAAATQAQAATTRQHLAVGQARAQLHQAFGVTP